MGARHTTTRAPPRRETPHEREVSPHTVRPLAHGGERSHDATVTGVGPRDDPAADGARGIGDARRDDAVRREFGDGASVRDA